MKSGFSGSAVSAMALSMAIFGSIGIFRRWIPLGSASLAAVRGFIGAAAIFCIMLILRKKPDLSAIRKNLPLLLLSGAGIGINWVLLFEAYEHTTVALATLCYYMAPIFVILASPIVLHEKLTLRGGLCVLAAALGMVGVSGVIGGGRGADDKTGILLGLAAAVFYASVILMNRKITGISAYDKTVCQLVPAAVIVLPYALAVEKTDASVLTAGVLILILCVGVVHTGLAYALYFGAIGSLPAQSAALLGYIDPIVAVILSVVLLREPLGVWEAIGVVCILGATMVGEFPVNSEKKKKENGIS